MSLDGLSLSRVLGELSSIRDAKIDKVQQPDRDSVFLVLHGPACGRTRLYLNVHNELGRLQLTSETRENPVTAPAFCMLLRKRLIGCRVTDVLQMGTDRVAAIRVSGRDELMDEQAYTLMLELTGRCGNLYLLDGSGTILDCLRHIGLGESAQRPALPGIKYELPPPQDKLDPFTASEADFAGLENGRQMMLKFARLSRQTAELIYEETDGEPARLVAFFSALQKGETVPCVLPKAGVLPFTPASRPGAVPCETVSAALTDYYKDRDVRLQMDRLNAGLKTTLEHAKTRCLHKLEGFTKDLNAVEEAETCRLYGELLTAFYGEAPRGAEYVECDNWYADPPCKIKVPLRPELGIPANAARYFKKYRKAKAAREYAEGEIGKLMEELAYLEGQLLSLSLAETSAESNEIREELIRQRYIRPEKDAKKPPKTSAKSKPLAFLSPDGVKILVGKNNVQNDSLTKNAPAGAWWFHVKDMPGSHVVADCRGTCTKETLQTAALLAAYYSSGRASSEVPVDYLPAQKVKKPAGARPGFVTFTGQRTVYVTPDETLLPPPLKD